MSSFTFSSEPDVEKCVSDQPLSVWTIAFIVFSLFVGFSLSGYISSFHSMGAANIRYETIWDDIEMIILGDSSEAAAIDTALLTENALNVSVSGSGYSSWEPVLRGVVSRTPNLHYMVISCDPMSRLRDGLTPRGEDLSDLVLRGANSSDLKGLSPVVKFETFLRYETFLATVLSKPKLSWADLVRLLKAGGVIQSKSAFKYNPEQGSLKKRAYLDLFEKKHCIESNEQAFRKMLAVAKELGLKVVLVRTPVTRGFMSEGEQDWESHSARILEITKIEMGASTVLVFDGSMLFPDDLSKFSDPNHVNAAAKVLFTQKLNEFMHEQFSIRDELSRSAEN